MSKIICDICGREEDPERWIPETAQKIDLDIRTDKKSPYHNGSDNILDYPKLYQTIAKIS